MTAMIGLTQIPYETAKTIKSHDRSITRMTPYRFNRNKGTIISIDKEIEGDLIPELSEMLTHDFPFITWRSSKENKMQCIMEAIMMH